MNLNPHRPWITPVVIGTFGLSAVTGVLMFFHLDSGLNKVAHEWMSWLLLAGVALHALLHLGAFQRHLKNSVGRWVVLGLVAVLALSFLPLGGSRQPQFVAPIQALAAAPMPVLAQVVGLSFGQLQARLLEQGLTLSRPQQTLQDLVGSETRAQVRVLNGLLRPSR